MTFDEYCEKKQIGLSRTQQACADVMLKSSECRRMLFGGAGVGRTFLFKLLEEYAKGRNY